jgi:hypothetical protein
MVVNKGATLSWGNSTTVATIGGTDVKITLPNTSTTTGSTDSTSKLYIIGATS